MFNIFGNSTINDTISWAPEPINRGTFGILSSCLITVSLCVWTAVHLNIPEHGSTFRPILRKIKWLCVGLLAPELVLVPAWYQFIFAQKTTAILNERQESEETLPSMSQAGSKAIPLIQFRTTEMNDMKVHESSKSKWTLRHGFFFNMGGLVLDTSSARGKFIPDDSPQYLVPNTEGIQKLMLLHPTIFDSITLSTINDKSKSGAFGKFIVCFQTIWFMAQSISRLAQDLPVSLLELNVFGHCVCSIIIYALWWQKPLDVAEAIVIPCDAYSNTLAWLWMGIARDEVRVQHWSSGSPSTECSTCINGAPLGYISRSTPRIGDMQIDPRFKEASREHLQNYPLTPKERYVRHGELLDDTGVQYHPDYGSPDIILLSDIDVRRWELAAPLLRQFGTDDRPRLVSVGRCRNLHFPFGLSVRNKILSVFIFVVSGMTYGGIHALAWNATFRTTSEQILWRVSTIMVMSFSVLFVALATYLGIGREGQRRFEIMTKFKPPMTKGMSTKESILLWAKSFALLCDCAFGISYLASGRGQKLLCDIYSQLMAVMVCIAFLAYVVGRTYLVIECFLSISHSPAGIYQQPNWSRYFPHIV